MANKLRRLLITAGEPAGIGPDLCLMLARRDWPVELVVVADLQLLAQRAAQLGESVHCQPVDLASPATPSKAGELKVLAVPVAATVRPGVLDTANAGYVLETLRQAVLACQQGQADAMVTAPLHKGVINEAGMLFTGHTEYLAELTATDEPVMMLATPGLRVALVTTHMPLANVSAYITQERLERVIRVLEQDLRARFGIERPVMLVCGLNPHAGEGGHLGREEIEVIEPVLTRLRAEGMNLQGPLPADTLFIPKYLDQADVVLAMYHDQGLPVLKHKGFGHAVNITLGLPLVRTSVDHGTALELAGTGNISLGSLHYAIEVACEMCQSPWSAMANEG